MGAFFAIGVFLWLGAFQGLSPFRRSLLLVFVAGGLVEITTRASVVNGLAGSSFSPLAPCLAWVMCLGLIWAAVSFNAVLLSRLGWFSPMARSLGLMTYPLYLLHQVIGFTLLEAARNWASNGVVLVVTVLSLVLLAYGVSAYLEPMVRRLMSRALAATFSVPTPASAAK